MTDEFINICDNKSDLFNAIVETLELPRRVNKKETKRLLSFVDNVVDYYLQMPAAEEIRYPIIYIPCAKDWAEEVCAEFLFYKIESTYDANRMGQLITLLYGYDLAKSSAEKELKSSIRPVMRCIRSNRNDNNTKNMFICGQGLYNRIIDKQKLKYFLGGTPNTLITCSTVIDAEDANVDYKEIENIFCIYSQNSKCKDYTPYSLNNWNGLKNCFIFKFSTSTYGLYKVINWGERLYDMFLHRYLLSQDDTQIRYQHFITLTNDEAHYIFNEKPQDMHTVISCPPRISNEDKRDIVDFYKGEGDFHFSINDRNILSLCFNQNIKDEYKNYLQIEKPDLYEYQHEWLEQILEYLPTDIIINTILDFVSSEKRAAFIICDAPESVKVSLKQLFYEQGLTINYYQYDALKNNRIEETKIVILCFCPHNLSSSYYSPKYPNSFDEFELNEGQSVIDIINEMAFVDYCKYKYDYDLRLCAITNSQYRIEKLGGKLKVPQKPQIQIVSHFDESNDDNERSQQGPIPTYTFTFADNSTASFPESEILICENNNHERFIKSIRDLKGEEDDDDEAQDRLLEIAAIQPISELADSTLDTFFKDNKNNPLLLEKIERNKYIKQGLIPEDQNHDIPIWKYLLERKIRDYCVEHDVIENNMHKTLWELLRQNLNNEHIKRMYSEMSIKVNLKYVLQNWCDLTKEKPFIPASKTDGRNLLINYLKLDQRILSLYHNKQLLKKNRTREKNRITEGFLCRILFDDITDELAAELLEAPQYTDYLPIENKEDIDTLKTIALENIKLKRIKSDDNSMQSDTEINSEENSEEETSYTSEEIANRANTSLKWTQYMDFLFDRAEYMKKRMAEENPIALNELDEIIKQIHDKYEEIESNSI